MLTKEHLKFHIRSDRVKPVFLEEISEWTSVVDGMREMLQQAKGQSLKELEPQWEQSGDAVVFSGLKKLAMEECQFADEDPEIETRRWEIFEKSRELRAKGLEFADFESQMAESCGDLVQLRSSLFADLAENRKITDVEKFSAGELIQRYNVSQVKGILWFAKNVEIEIDEASSKLWRSVFRCAKFHQLILDFRPEPKTKIWHIHISGPLSIFQNAQTYAMRISNFFPILLHLPKWKMVADVKLKGRMVQLKIDQKAGLKPISDLKGGYIPEEFAEVMRQFNDSFKDWTLNEGEEPVNLGKSNYFFPDFTLCKKGKAHFQIELFHRWHLAALQSRLEALLNHPRGDVRFGLSKVMRKDPAIAKFLKEHEGLQQYVFDFGDFPTVQQLRRLVE